MYILIYVIIIVLLSLLISLSLSTSCLIWNLYMTMTIIKHFILHRKWKWKWKMIIQLKKKKMQFQKMKSKLTNRNCENIKYKMQKCENENMYSTCSDRCGFSVSYFNFFGFHHCQCVCSFACVYLFTTSDVSCNFVPYCKRFIKWKHYMNNITVYRRKRNIDKQTSYGYDEKYYQLMFLIMQV